MIDKQLQDSDLEYKDVSKEDIPLILKQNEIDTKKLISTINHHNSVHVVTCWDAEKKRLFYFIREKEELESLRIISAQN